MSEGRPDSRGYADEAEIRAMVDRYSGELKAVGAIESAAVERAFRTVERHRLLETFYHRGAEGTSTLEHDPGHPRRDHLTLIYADTVLATRHINGRPASSTSQASLVAKMLEFLDLGEGMKILEVGAGTGYNAALLAEIVGDQRRVVTVDVQEDVVDQTRRLLAHTTAGRATRGRAPRSAVARTAGPRWRPTGCAGGRTCPWPVSSTAATASGTRAAGRPWGITRSRSRRSAPTAIRRRADGRSNGGSTASG